MGGWVMRSAREPLVDHAHTCAGKGSTYFYIFFPTQARVYTNIYYIIYAYTCKYIYCVYMKVLSVLYLYVRHVRVS